MRCQILSIVGITAAFVITSRELRAQSASTAAEKKDIEAKIVSAMTAKAEQSDSLLVPPARKPNKKIKSNYDRFRQSTQVSATVVKSGMFNLNELSIEAYFGYAGKTMTMPPKFVLFSFRPDKTSDWQLLKDHSVIFLVNDTTSIDAGETYHDGEVDNGSPGVPVMVREQVTAIIPVRDFVRIANAEKLELRLAEGGVGKEHRFKPNEIETMRDLASMLKPESSPTP
jgi:hypothetical protein